MSVEVLVSRLAEKQLRKLPRHIVIHFDLWVKTVEEEGLRIMTAIPGYRDHALKGELQGLRSVSLSRSYRVIYSIDESKKPIIIEIIEVNKHVYKK